MDQEIYIKYKQTINRGKWLRKNENLKTGDENLRRRELSELKHLSNLRRRNQQRYYEYW